MGGYLKKWGYFEIIIKRILVAKSAIFDAFQSIPIFQSSPILRYIP